MRTLQSIIPVVCFLFIFSNVKANGEISKSPNKNEASLFCNRSSIIESTRPEYPDLDSEGPFCPGETVEFCYTLDFQHVDPIDNCGWIQGLLPTIGCGWDVNLNDIQDQGPGGDWFWLDEGEVNYNVDNPNISLDTDCCGETILVEGGSLSPGDLMPKGFWIVSNAGGANCTNTGNPNTGWGMPSSCGSSTSVEFCFNLTVKNLADPDCFDDCDGDLLVQIFDFSDRETGCWVSDYCLADVPASYEGISACDSPMCLTIIDNDNDGYDATVDCDDNNPNINPGAIEICDDIDNNCNGVIDEGLLSLFYLDMDNDGFGDPGSPTMACGLTTGISTSNTDCDDSDPAVNPMAIEICDAIDNNCDGQINEGLIETYYIDQDGDGYGDPNQPMDDCMLNVGFSVNSLDCDDTNPTVYNGADELCDGLDNDCNGQIDDGIMDFYYQDLDNDGFGNDDVVLMDCMPVPGYSLEFGDCDDQNTNVNPEVPEFCDGLDNNCNGQIDEGVGQTYFLDTDGDGYGDPNNTVIDCILNPNYSLNDTDCDDTNPNVNPGAAELCDGIDNNCNGQIDEGLGQTYFLDTDGDGYGDPNNSVVDCILNPNYSLNNTDCDDTNPNINPGMTELCDGIDNNCNGQIDEGLLSLYYLDTDQDGFGDANNAIMACTATAGYSANNLDCDDGNAAVYPDAPEICDLVDNDCDGQVDEGVESIFYIDADNDGFGNPDISVLACTLAIGYSIYNTDCNDNDANINPGAAEIPNNGIDENCDGEDLVDVEDIDLDGFTNDTDCDDLNPNINPGAVEVCDGTDNNCNGQIDEGVLSIFYVDTDGDGYGDPSNSISACTPPQGYTDDNTDCNDNDPNIYPLAEEECDGIDNNCNGEIDEDSLSNFYLDNDNDGYGNSTDVIQACVLPTGYSTNNTDCNDNDPSINPGNPDIPNNGIDENCDGTDQTMGTDNDNDGFFGSDDCDDTDPSINPAAIEVCDGVDNNCNGLIDDGLTFETYYTDEDMDGYGVGVGVSDCNQLLNAATEDGDCDDNDPSINPSQSEIPNNDVDEDCDGEANVIDIDGDGWNSDEDCDDNDDTINPDADDIDVNGVDENCDGVDGPSSSQELNGFSIEIYPNPVGNLLRVQTDHKKLTYTIYNVGGQDKMAGVLDHEIDLMALSAGVYILVLTSDDEHIFVVERIVKI